MPDPTPTSLAACDESLPLLPITRQFDFGQFVFLRADKAPTSHNPFKPNYGKQVVVDPSGGTYQRLRDWLERYQKIDIHKRPGGGVPPKLKDPVTALLGGVSLQKLLTKDPVPENAPVWIDVGSNELRSVLQDAVITYRGTKYEVDLSSTGRDALLAGSSALVSARAAGGHEEPFMTQLRPNVDTRMLDEGEMDTLLARGEISNRGQAEHVELGADATAALLAGTPVLTWVNGSGDALVNAVRLAPPPGERRPVASSLAVDDLGAFFAAPSVPGADGRPIPVELESREVHELRTTGVTTVVVGETPVTVYGGAPSGGAIHPVGSPSIHSVGGDGIATTIRTLDAGTATTSSAATAYFGDTVTVDDGTDDDESTTTPLGLPVAVFLPWRQTWKLTGFSRGELRHSLALAPQEETTIEILSWERRLRSLDQTALTETEESFESAQTEREADDVFQELTHRHDFAWQVEGSVDATYNAGTGSITVSAGGGVTDAQQLQQIARNTQRRMKESTQKAAAKVRSLRVTHITDSIESGRQERVTRTIRNPNYSHTLTLDFFETLAHYEVTLAPVPERLGLVALIPNPLATKEFDTPLIRLNETALRRALLDPALADGFAAAREITAYAEAKKILDNQAAKQKEHDALADTQTADDKEKDPAGKQLPQEKEVVELLKQISAAAKTTKDNAKIAEALDAIKNGKDVTPEQRRNGQYWLFRQLCAKYFPSLLDALDSVPAAPKIDDAAALAAVIPAPGSATTLANLNDKSDVEKEQSGLGPEITKHITVGTWAWKTGRAREENLYTANDAGLAGLVDRFFKAHDAWQAKRAEGEMAVATNVAIAKTNAKQDKLTSEDKLAMAFPLDELAAAVEREDALRKHLNKHLDHYSFALFQALSPAEQNAYIEAQSSGALKVGMFEPRVIAISGSKLAVPLSPPPAGPLHDMLEALRTSFRDAFATTAETPDKFIFPTAGLTINSRLGKCSACEEFIEESRKIELRRLAAEADAAEQEAARREARIKAGDLDDPDVETAPVRVEIDQPA
jgi:hypothetical protein